MLFFFFRFKSFDAIRQCVRGHKLIDPYCVTAKILKKHNEILMTAKAYNNRCILEWLAHVLGQARVNAVDDRISMMFLAMMLAQTERISVCRKATNSCLLLFLDVRSGKGIAWRDLWGCWRGLGDFCRLAKTNAASCCKFHPVVNKFQIVASQDRTTIPGNLF